MSAGLPSTTQSVSPPPGFVLLDALLAVADVEIGVGLVKPLRGISFGVDGDIKVDSLFNIGEIIPAAHLAAAIQHGCVIKKIYKIGTTATKLIGWY